MSESDLYDRAVRAALHHAVDDLHASPDLAQRVETKGAARRRRNRGLGVTGAIVLVAGSVGGVLAASHTPSSVSATSVRQLPACAANLSAHTGTAGEYAPEIPARAPDVPVVPGKPVAAVVCRYAGGLAGSAAVTDQAQLAALQSAMNGSKGYTGVVNCALIVTESRVTFVYPQGTPELTVEFIPACASVYTNVGSYWASADVGQLITGLTGTSSPSAR
jgi:hypothetical protein